MKQFLSVLWTCLLSLRVEGRFYFDNHGILVLNDQNFDSAVQEYPNLMVEFYAPWCGHCKKLEPEYAKVAADLSRWKSVVRLAKFDGSQASRIVDRYKLTGFPTLLFFRRSTSLKHVEKYTSQRSAQALEQWILQRVKPVLLSLTSRAEYDEFLQANDISFIVFVDQMQHKLPKLLQQVALKKRFKDLTFGVVSVPNMLTEIGADIERPSLIIKKKYKVKEIKYEGKMELHSLEVFIDKHRIPLIRTFTSEEAAAGFHSDLSTHVLLFSDPSQGYHTKFMSDVLIPAEQNVHSILHIHVNPQHKQMLRFCKLKPRDLPAIVLICLRTKTKKYFYPKQGKELISTIGAGFSTELDDFEFAYLQGTLQQRKHPRKEGAEYVTARVLSNEEFQQLLKTEKDVLIEYCPATVNCQHHTEMYDELANRFAHIDSIVIAKMDEFPDDRDDQLQHPKVMFYSSQDKYNPIEVKSDTSVEHWTEFVYANAQEFQSKSRTFDHEEL